jgi:deoxyribonuclease V
VILAVDVDYRVDTAIVAGIIFSNWRDESPDRVVHSKMASVEDYEPGQFYKREMPCIIQLLTDYKLTPDFIVIDGFVALGQESKPGLGMHLHDALDRKIPVIGVAKSSFKNSRFETEVLRGSSQKPLYVTAVGVACETAKNYIRSMHGKHRIPTLLKLVDRECRKS